MDLAGLGQRPRVLEARMGAKYQEVNFHCL
jgi:hypothetical protein